MKFYYLLFLLLVGGFIFVISTPPVPRQAQEEPPGAEQISRNTYRITADIKSMSDRSIADIVWFQKAAELALEKKIPWFNVQEQSISATKVEGIIKLERDPMKAEYDAHEIISLQLSDEVAE